MQTICLNMYNLDICVLLILKVLVTTIDALGNF